MKQFKILAKEFFGAPSAKCSAEGGDRSVLERWFRELGVGWVLHVADGASAGELEHALDASSWFPAFTKIMDTFRLTSGLLMEEEHATESDEEQNMAEQLQLASFTQQAMLKMLTFVDFIVAPNLTCQLVFVVDGVPVPAPCEKLHALLCVRETLCKIQLPFCSSSSAKVERIQDEILNILSAKEGEAIWTAIVEFRTRILESLEVDQGSSSTQSTQGSSDIDKATTSDMMYVIMFLEHNYWLVGPIVSEAARLGKYAPRFGAGPPFRSLIKEMVSCLKETLVNKSQAFPDQGLRFLFLLNNSSFIADKFPDSPHFFKSYKVQLAGKVEGYMERYIQVSWVPVLSCLINPTPSCLGKNCSPLSKFEFEFQKIYTTQKLWKVPNPRVRNRLRRAIIHKIIPAYTRYLADDYGNDPRKFSPSNLEEMLQELFEG